VLRIYRERLTAAFPSCVKTFRLEPAMIRDLGTDRTKREMFNRLHEHLNRLADEVDEAMKKSKEE
jgi:hypothetical protein